MELVVVLVVLLGLWAALLLPSFLDSRNDAPITSTHSFETRLARLAAIRAEGTYATMHRRRLQARRRRVIIGLVGAAIVSLVAAIATGSIPLLILSLAFDGLFVLYLMMLNQADARRHHRPVPATIAPPVEPEPEPEPQYGRLRVLEGGKDYREASGGR